MSGIRCQSCLNNSPKQCKLLIKNKEKCKEFVPNHASRYWTTKLKIKDIMGY